jgi:membrane protein implicated in regulation of membrane protease activity
MLHAFRLTIWFGFIAPIAALVAFAYVWKHPYLLWAVPLGLVVLALVGAALAIAYATWEGAPEARKAREQMDKGADEYVRSRLLNLPIHEAPPPER